MQKLKPGDLVRVRRSRWRIVDVRSYDACQLVTLAGTGAAAHDRRRVIAPFDTVDPIGGVRRMRVVGAGRWRHACRDLLVVNTPPGALRCARRARMDLLPHQLEPALAILRGAGSRVLLADDVGLGKTVQAGLIVAELQERGWADRVLVLTPAGLRDQWAAELSDRLGVDATIVDAARVRERVAALPVGVNPWTTTPVAIASMDYVKRSEVLPPIASCRWDVVVIDEAHGVAHDSDRFRAAAALSSRAAYVLLLTATPHSGDRRAFVSLCGIGAHGDDPVMIFRRTRRDVRIGVKRRVRLLRVRPTRQERRVHALLARFTRAVHDERGGDAALALSVLHKRALSSARSLERSVERRLAALVPGDTAATAQLTLPLDDPAGELLADDDVPAWSADVSLADAGRERRMLAALCGAAREASGHEAKIRALKRLLRRVDEPAIVFTEYRDTLLHLHDSLGRPAVLLHGGLGREERAAALADFSAGRCSTLLATDAGGEGLNLHHRCRLVINLELPWNPMRLEQRIGRVDRIGQRRTVHAIHLIARETGEPRILDRLTARMARAHADIAAPDPIGHDEERAVAALIITGASASGEEAPAAGPTMPAGCVFPCLAQEAIAEAARLTALRALPSGATGACDADAWLVRARHRTTRARLRGRILLILQAAYEDGYGRIAESTLVFVALRISGAAWHLLRRSESLAAIERAVSPQIEVALSAWREEAARTSSAFTSARLRRERTMSARGRGTLVQVGQPGLFDRRADAARAEEAARRRTEDEEDQQRYDAIERAACLSYGVPRILLAIAP